MGILPGTELALVRCGAAGPVIVDVRGSQFILGRGMAQRVLVERLP
jgi:Fe2+ transport system protein FeoA